MAKQNNKKKNNGDIVSLLVDSVVDASISVYKMGSRYAYKKLGIVSEEDKIRIEEEMKLRQEEEEHERELMIERKNKLNIKGRELNFNELFFNCGLKNKLKDMPVLEETKSYKSVDIYSFKLPTGVAISSVRDKIEHIADFFEVPQMNVKLQKKKGLMDIIITRDNMYDKVFGHKDYGLSKGLKIPMGHFINQDYIEKLLVIDMAKDDIPHAFIGSTTGGGKSNFIRVMLLNWVMNKSPEDLELFIIDGKGGTDYMSLLGAPQVFMNKCFTDMGDILTILSVAIDEILKRNQIFIKAGANNYAEYIELGNKMPRRVIVFDEYAMYHGEKGYKDMQSKVGKICATGRSAGVHIIVATQDGRKEILDSMIKYNMPLKIGFKCDNAQHSKNISGYEGLETINKIGVGRAYGLPIEGEYVQFKSMKAPSSKEIKNMIDKKYPPKDRKEDNKSFAELVGRMEKEESNEEYESNEEKLHRLLAEDLDENETELMMFTDNKGELVFLGEECDD